MKGQSASSQAVPIGEIKVMAELEANRARRIETNGSGDE